MPSCQQTLWGVVILAGLYQPLPADELQLFEQSARHMGTTITIKLYAIDKSIANRGFTAAFQRIGQLDRIMSDYDEASELSRLSASAPTVSPIALSDDLYAVLFAAEKMSKESDGAFDVTVGPLTKLWRRARRQRELPSQERLREALAAVGYREIQLDTKQRTATLNRPQMRLDLGGIGQGYAADAALGVLKGLGLRCATVDVSGDIAFGDPPPGTRGWRTGIAPLDAESPPHIILTLSNCAISTSGDAFQFVEIEGIRYSHIVDPRTGLGLRERMSATILTRDCTTADCLATAVCVLGHQHGLDLVEKFPSTSTLVVFQRDGKTQVLRSKLFPSD